MTNVSGLALHQKSISIRYPIVPYASALFFAQFLLRRNDTDTKHYYSQPFYIRYMQHYIALFVLITVWSILYPIEIAPLCNYLPHIDPAYISMSP